MRTNYEALLPRLYTQSPDLKPLAEWRRVLFPDSTSIAERMKIFADDDRLRTKVIVTTAFRVIVRDVLALKGNSKLQNFVRSKGIAVADSLFGYPFSEEEFATFKDYLARVDRATGLNTVLEVVLERLVLPELVLLRAVFPDRTIRIPPMQNRKRLCERQ